MQRRLFLIVLVALGLVLAPVSPVLAQEGPEGFQTQTIMIYIIGSDLESESGLATGDIREMLQARPDEERLDVLVMTGGTTRWAARTIPRDQLSVYRIEGANPRLVHQWESASMGQPETLARFLEYGVTAYPADSYGLILWDHGGGPMVGFGVDTLFRHDGLTLFELKEALDQSPFDQENRLEWLAFDACLMASLEVASLMAPYARYMVASEETLPGHGFDYRFLGALSATRLTGPEVAREIIDRTYGFYEELSFSRPQHQNLVTLSLLDLSQAAATQEALDGLFADLDQGLSLGIYSEVARRRDQTKAYGRTSTTDNYDLIDLSDLADNLASLYPNQTAALKAQIGRMVGYNRANVARSGGLSLYFPLANKTHYERAWASLYQSFDVSPAYKAFMAHYGGILLSGSLSAWTGDEAPPVSYDEEAGLYFIQLSPQQAENYKSGQYYVLSPVWGDEYMMVYMSSDLTLDEGLRLQANFNGKTMYIQNAAGENSLIPMMEEKENIGGIASYQIPMVLDRLTPEGGHESASGNLLAEIDKNTGQARITGAIRDDASGDMMGKRDTDLNAWDNIHFTYNSAYLTRDEGGRLLPLGDWASADTPWLISFPLKEGLSVRYGDIMARDGEYMVLISVVDTQMNVYSSELLPMKAREGAPEPEELPRDIQASFSFSQQEPVPLWTGEGLILTLDGILTGPQDTLPQTLSLLVGAQNTLQEEVSLATDWVMLEGHMMAPIGYVSIPAGEAAMLRMDFPLYAQATSPSLQQAGLNEVREIRFRFSLGFEADSLLSSAFSPVFHITTQVPLGDIPSLTSAFPPVTLAEGEGLTVQMAGAPFMDESYFYLPLYAENQTSGYDRLLLEAAVNGVMTPFSLSHHLPPGARMYAWATIPVYRYILPPELSEFQHLFEGLDNLEALGIKNPRELNLRFGLDREASSQREPALMLPAATYRLPAGEGQDPPLDTEGRLLFDQGGLRVVRLASDPEGKKLYLHNAGPVTLRVSTFGRTQVDGLPYGLNMPIRAVISPGQSAYVRLFDYLPGIEPQGEELRFQINLINVEENTLLLQSDPITLTLYGAPSPQDTAKGENP